MDRGLGGAVALRIEPVESESDRRDARDPGGGVRASEVPGGVGGHQRVGIRGEIHQAVHRAGVVDRADSEAAEGERQERALVAFGAHAGERGERRAAAGPAQRFEELRPRRGIGLAVERAQERVLGGRVRAQAEREGRVGPDRRLGIGQRFDQGGDRRRVLNRRERERRAGADRGIGIRQCGDQRRAVARVLGVDQPLEIGAGEELVGRTGRPRLREPDLAAGGQRERQYRERGRRQPHCVPPRPGRDSWEPKLHGGRQDS